MVEECGWIMSMTVKKSGLTVEQADEIVYDRNTCRGFMMGLLGALCLGMNPTLTDDMPQPFI